MNQSISRLFAVSLLTALAGCSTTRDAHVDVAAAQAGSNVAQGNAPGATSDVDLLRAGAFALPLVPVGATTPEENAELALALRDYERSVAQTGARDAVEALTRFVGSRPTSAWKPVLLVNLGSIYRQTGHFSQALESWQAAWALSKQLPSEHARAVADAAAGHLSQLLAYLGRQETLEPLLRELERRPLHGTAAELVNESSRGLADMQLTPELAFKCGPFALSRILQYQGATVPARSQELLQASQSSSRGLSLTAVQTLSERVGMQYQMAFRRAGASVIVPSVAHWNVGHYAAIVDREASRYRIQDSTFGEDIRMSAETLDTEASGYFLIPAGPLPVGYRQVSAAEGESIWGRGDTGNNKDNGATGSSEAIGAQDSCEGCTTWSVEPMVVSLALQDVPVGYATAVGPALRFDLHYSHRDVQQPQVFNYANLGRKWTTSWLSYATDNANVNGTVELYRRGGGNETFAFDAGSTTSRSGPFSQSLLIRQSGADGGTSGFTRQFGDGSTEVFEKILGNKYFMTSIVDPHGNAVRIAYDEQLRIMTLTDAIGQVTKLAYELASDPLKITSVTDPFGRSATFTYNAEGMLESITDTLGIVSKYSYGKADFIDTLETPYGKTHFEYGDSTTDMALGNTRFLNVTDALGRTSRVEFRQAAPGIDISDNPTRVPTGMQGINDFLQWRNTFIWNPVQYAEAKKNGGDLDYSKARLIHWLHTSDSSTARVPESTKEPLENRVWFDYPGQTQALYVGTSNQPLRIGRVLDDGSTQLSSFEYSPTGALTRRVDPTGRAYAYGYADNGIDAVSVTNVTAGANERLLTVTYDDKHSALSVKTADGSSTNYAYDARGLLTKTTDPLGAVTSFSYDARGYLAAVDEPMNAHTVIAHDDVGRITSTTDPAGITIQYRYDAADRRTSIMYPDGSSAEYAYHWLDLSRIKDRQGHVSELAYDAERQLTQVVDALGRSTKLEYSADGTISTISDPAGQVTQILHDLQGRAQSKRYADGSTQTVNHEQATSRVHSLTDALGQQTVYTYTIDDRVTKLSYPDAKQPTAPVTLAYDALYGRLISISDGVGETQLTYYPSTSGTVGAGQLESVSSPVAGAGEKRDSLRYGYDALGRVITQSVNGIDQTHSYDALGRVTALHTALDDFALTYDDTTPRVASIASKHGPSTKLSYYDAKGQGLLKQIDVVKQQGDRPLASFAYRYDAARNVVKFAESYFGAELESVASAGGLQPPGRGTRGEDTGASTHTDTSARLALTVAQALRVNPAVWLMLLAAVLLIWFAVRRSVTRSLPLLLLPLMAATFCTSVNRTPPHAAGKLTSYSYDLANRLVSVLVNDGTPAAPGAQFQYAYDAASNLTSILDKGVSKTLAYTATNALQTGRYDPNGSPLQLGAAGYEWDAQGRMVKIAAGNHSSEFSYDGLGQLVRIVERDGDKVGADHAYFWCGGQRCLEHDNLKPDSPVHKQYFEHGVRVEDESFYYVRDQLGSVRQLVDAQGSVRAQYDYDPYGAATKQRGDLDSDLRYAGYFHHAPTGLALATHRAYDPALGRWLNRDPIAESGGLNLYGYVGGNPIKYNDPSGTNPLLIYLYACAVNPACVEAVVAGGLTVAALLGSDDAAQMLEAMPLGGAMEGRTASVVGKEVCAAAKGAWALKPFARGVAIENALGRNLPGNFPVIDRFANGIATSIKSLDLSAKSYQSAATLGRTVAGYIDKVAGFTGRTWAGVTVRGGDITGRVLELAVPAGGGTPAQQAALQAAVQYGQSIGVTVLVIPF